MIKFIKGIFKVIFGFILLIMLFNTVKDDTVNELSDSEIRMRRYMESSAKSSLNYPSTYNKGYISITYNAEENRIYGTISYSGKNAFGISKNYIGKISVNLNKDFTIDSKDKTSKFVIQ
tara:strand:- start:75 stop:431 length:357 start_codon:yes stop_codon:yes gene_type:complete